MHRDTSYYYYGGNHGHFYESVWEWNGYAWERRADAIRYRFFSVSDPCGAMNPLELFPNFYSSPPFRAYEAWHYQLGKEWVRCLSLRNY